MRALVLEEKLIYRNDYPLPLRKKGEALIRVKIAGICNTDIEILKGYMNFKGIPGHEFVGIVEDADQSDLIGKRVVGEINIGCGVCDYCKSGLKIHCKDRKVLGIFDKDGAFAEYLTLPVENIHIIPESITDDEAVFVEPLAASFEILEQINIGSSQKVCILGDGKLGLLVAQVISITGCDLILVGHHDQKLSIAKKSGIETCLASNFREREFDIVIDCTGSRSGIQTALDIVKPRGIIVLKTTVAEKDAVDMNKVVINEITIIGSRCGPFDRAIKAIESGKIDLLPLITARFRIEQGIEAINHASKKEALKVLIDMDN